MRTVSERRFFELVEADVYLRSIKDALKVETAAEALEKVKELTKERDS